MLDRSIPDQVSEAMENVEEITGVNVKKKTATITRNTYAAMAAAVPLALGPVAPVPTISQVQEPVKRPEEHLPSQSQAPANTVGGTGFLVVAASTSSTDFSIVDSDGMKVYFTIPPKPKPPL